MYNFKKSNHNLAKQAVSNLSKSIFSASLPSLVMKPSHSYPASAAAPLARTRSNDFGDDADNFYSYLGKSVAKIEKDLEEKLTALGPSGRNSNPDAVRVLNSFYDLKRVLEGSVYTDAGTKKKTESFFTKIGTWFSSKG